VVLYLAQVVHTCLHVVLLWHAAGSAGLLAAGLTPHVFKSSAVP
jgi:hypothetical protein